jgi:tRNA U34 5-carboxymethylaminomethyl modifying enzyme MnmG/GidA
MNAENITGFKLEKTKNSQTIKIDYFVPELNRSRTDVIEDQPHIDLLNALKGLNHYLADIFHADKEYAGIYEITGFKYNGDKIILTGKLTTDNGGVIGISSPSIDTDGDSYRFEEELAQKLSTLSLEVHHFLTGKKTGVKQLTIDDQVNITTDEIAADDDSLSDDNNTGDYSEEQFITDLNEEDKMDINFELPEDKE